MKNKKIIVLICAVIIVLVGAIAGVVISKKNSNKHEQSQAQTEVKQDQGEEEKNASETDTQADTEADKKTADESKSNENASDNTDKQSASANVESEKVYTPTLIYFVSNSDENYEDTMKMLDELKKEYKDKINFDVRSMDENPDEAENFELVKGNTPAFIMLDTKNDISAIQLKCSDKALIKQAMEDALK